MTWYRSWWRIQSWIPARTRGLWWTLATKSCLHYILSSVRFPRWAMGENRFFRYIGYVANSRGNMIYRVEYVGGRQLPWPWRQFGGHLMKWATLWLAGCTTAIRRLFSKWIMRTCAAVIAFRFCHRHKDNDKESTVKLGLVGSVHVELSPNANWLHPSIWSK